MNLCKNQLLAPLFEFLNEERKHSLREEDNTNGLAELIFPKLYSFLKVHFYPFTHLILKITAKFPNAGPTK